MERARAADPCPPLAIGLVNGMPAEARRRTERQLRTILDAASPIPVRLDVIALDRVDSDMLDATALDGLIVTGMSPGAASLTEEAFWPQLTALADFAVARSLPTVWSCLAAHAAVLHLDGFDRRRLPRKLTGLFECVRTGTDDPIARGLPATWTMPHSRYNDLPEDGLIDRGYRVVSRSAETGADVFTKSFGEDAPFLFCQGHPEYDADMLLREYRRDVRQFLTGVRDRYPDAPRGIFSATAAAALEPFRARAERERSIDTMAAFPWTACVGGLAHAWHDVAIGLYANWLTLVATGRAVCLSPPHHARAGVSIPIEV